MPFRVISRKPAAHSSLVTPKKSSTTLREILLTCPAARYLEDPYIIVSGVTFESNHSDQFGGALYVEPKGRIIGGEGLRFIGNNADLDGGAIYLQASGGNAFDSGAVFTGTPARAAEALSTFQTDPI